jgi:hypothetical protein
MTVNELIAALHAHVPASDRDYVQVFANPNHNWNHPIQKVERQNVGTLSLVFSTPDQPMVYEDIDTPGRITS